MRGLFPAILVVAALGGAPVATDLTFDKRMIDGGSAESCAFMDVNGDGLLDIVSGENWFEAPDWKKHWFRPVYYESYYLNSFSVLPLDVNGDGKIDIVDGGWHNRKLWWNENPGAAGGEWKEHVIESGHNVEFAFLVDLENQGAKRDILPEFGDREAPLAWYEPKGGGFVKHVVSGHSYGHGIGAGDVNGDGRVDILTPEGWFEAPPDPRTGEWKFHGDWQLGGDGGLGFMFVLDINGDGKNDVITTEAHNYGFFWMENKGGGTWVKHMIDDGWAGGHAMTMVDLNGDGKMDFVTGKRYFAHNGHDPGEHDPLGIYWYEFDRKPDGKVEWHRHVIDYGGRTGAGMQVAVADFDRDGRLDIAVGGKSGLFLFHNLTPR